VFEPPWAQEGAPFFAGLEVITSETVDWYEAGKHRRVFVVAMPGRTPSVPDGYRPDAEWRPGRITVHRFIPPDPGRLVYDFLARIADARVTRVHPDRREECRTFRQDRWHCGPEHPWQYVGRLDRDIAGAVREVIWAHPLNGNHPIEIRYPGVPLGGTLVLHYGWTQRAVEAGLGAPVTFRVTAGDRVLFERVLGLQETDWFEQRLDTSAFRGRREDVVFSVATPDHQNRQFCFTADLWER